MPDKPPPIPLGLERSISPRRRDLQLVPVAQLTIVEVRFERARGARTVVDRDLFAVTAIDPDFDHWTGPGPAPPKIDEVEAQCVKCRLDNSFQF